MNTQRGQNRFHTYHPTKRQVLGPAQIQPAWRSANIPSSSRDPGGKVLVANLPSDVSVEEVKVRRPICMGPVHLTAEVQELFQRTVGHVSDLFIIYNSKGLSKGMSIVTFASAKLAVIARQKYNGKLVDGRASFVSRLPTHSDKLVQGIE
jgi:THO complex subunit 4